MTKIKQIDILCIFQVTISIVYFNIAFILVQLLPLFIPCVLADRVGAEVCILKETLASKLYENELGAQFTSILFIILVSNVTHFLN